MAYPDYPENEFVDIVDESYLKKKKDKSKKDIPFENALEGYILEPVDVSDLSKGHLNWSRVGKQPLKFSNAKLSEISRKVFVEKQLGPMSVFNSLSADQRGVITRVIEECQSNEKDKNAVWVLECVRKYNKAVRKNWRHSLIVCNKLMVIVKRQEKLAGKDGRIPYKPITFNANEIIDLKIPSKKKNKKNKNKDDEWEQLPFDDNAMFEELQQSPDKYDRNDNYDHRVPDSSGRFTNVPEGAIEIPPNWPQHPPELPRAYPNSPMSPTYEHQYFEPRREPPIEARAYTPSPHLHDDHHSRSRSRSRHRREEAALRRDEAHELEMELLRRREREDILDRIRKMEVRDRSPSDDSYRAGEEAYWSGASRGSITPPSSPSLSEIYPGGRHGEREYRRDEGYPSRDRSRRYYRDGVAYAELYSSAERRHRRRDELEGRLPEGGMLRYPSSSLRGPKRVLLHQHNSDPRNLYGTLPRRRALLTQEAGEVYFPADFNDAYERRGRRSRAREEADMVYRDDRQNFGRRARAWPS
jgi:hypothetical protein